MGSCEEVQNVSEYPIISSELGKKVADYPIIGSVLKCSLEYHPRNSGWKGSAEVRVRKDKSLCLGPFCHRQ